MSAAPSLEGIADSPEGRSEATGRSTTREKSAPAGGREAASEEVTAAPVGRLVDLLGAGDPTGRRGRGPLLPGARVQALDLAVAGTGTYLLMAARRAVLAARTEGCGRVVCGSAGPYGAAVGQAAADLDMEALVVVPIGTDPAMVGRIAGTGARVMSAGVTLGQTVAFARARVRSSIADLSVGGPYSQQILQAAGGIVETLAQQSPASPTALWIPLGSGATAAGVSDRVRLRGWTTAVYGVGIAHGHSVVTSWPGQHRPVPGGRQPLPATMRVQEPGWSLVRDVAEHGAVAMDRLRGTGGEPVGVGAADLVRARELLARHGVHASPAGSAGLAGLLAESARGRTLAGRHVAVVTG